MVVSTVLLGAGGVWVTEKLVVPYLEDQNTGIAVAIEPLTAAQRRGLWAVLAWTLCFGLLLALGLAPGWLHDPDQPGFLAPAAPPGNAGVVALFSAVAGGVVGRGGGRDRGGRGAMGGVEPGRGTP